MTSHPLDPLTAPEISRAAAIVRRMGGLTDRAWFETIALHEPSKQALRDGTARRSAYVCCYDPQSGETWNGVAELDAGTLAGWHHVEGAQARIIGDEFAAGAAMARHDPRVIAALAKRGITDVSQVLIECWGAGHFGFPEDEGLRLAYGHCWLRNEAGDNPYARPISNLHPVIDLRHMMVLRVDDFGVVPLPPEGPPIRGHDTRKDVRPIEITQPEGPSFTVDGHEVRWQKWRLRVGFHVRDGLILHAIGYEDKGRVRPIMHRASLAEMVVPYGDPSRRKFSQERLRHRRIWRRAVCRLR